MKNLKIKIVIGFRKDQIFTIDAEEAHKAYYLFLNPDKRGVFSNGVAVRGQDIQTIEPDYNATMGWNPLHQIGPDDMNEIRRAGVDREMVRTLTTAKHIAQEVKPEMLSLPLSKLAPPVLPERARQISTSNLAKSMSIPASVRTAAQQEVGRKGSTKKRR